MRGRLTILMYHRILPAERCEDYPLESLVMPKEVFKAQMRWLARHSRVLPVREALYELCGNRDGSSDNRPLVSVTFDDGYRDNAEHALPMLEANGIRGTFFITTGFVADQTPLWHDRAAVSWSHLPTRDRSELLAKVIGSRNEIRTESVVQARSAYDRASDDSVVPGIATWMQALKDARPDVREEAISVAEERAGGEFDVSLFQPLTIKQVKEMHASGHEIASHTVTHPVLPQLTDDDLTAELIDSRDQIRDWTNASEIGFCYPVGYLDRRVESAVRDAGYSYACTIEAGRNSVEHNRMRLARIDITRRHVLDRSGQHDELGFRAEVSRLRSLWRGNQSTLRNTLKPAAS